MLGRQPIPHAPPSSTPTQDSGVVASVVQQMEHRRSSTSTRTSSTSILPWAPTPSASDTPSKHTLAAPVHDAVSTPQAFRQRWKSRSPASSSGALQPARGRSGAQAGQATHEHHDSHQRQADSGGGAPPTRAGLSLPGNRPDRREGEGEREREREREREKKSAASLSFSSAHESRRGSESSPPLDGVLSYYVRPGQAAAASAVAVQMQIDGHPSQPTPTPTWC